MRTRHWGRFYALAILQIFMQCGISGSAGAQEPDLAQVHLLLKKLEARVATLEDQNIRLKHEADEARAQATALRASRPAVPTPQTSKGSKPTPALEAYAMATKAVSVTPRAATPIASDSWSGPYWGISIGGASTRSQVTSQETYRARFPTNSAPFDLNQIVSNANATANRNPGATFDLFAGANMRFGQYVLGGVQLEGSLAELDFNSEGTRALNYFNSIGPTGQTAVGPFRPHVHSRWMISALARAGTFIDPSTLLYAIAGVTLAQFEYQNLTDNLFFQPGERFFSNGANVGGGIEHKINSHWSIRAEYRYTKFRDVEVSNNFSWSSSSGGAVSATQTNAIQTHFENQMHVGRLGFSYQPTGDW
jgi:opacity protein-like surface antigen